jgi:signal recognition particle receptor subunit beta
VTYVNYSAREINVKIVYYGPGLGGKTTNLQCIYSSSGAKQQGKLISLATETDRTLFFDFMPLDLGNIRGFRTRLHLYTVPGQVFYNASRKLILKGVDGIVQVADSQVERLDANIESINNLQENLREHGYDLETIPYVLQLNKRDLKNAMPADDLAKKLRVKNEPVLEAVATDGKGVFQSLKAVAKLILIDLRQRLV